MVRLLVNSRLWEVKFLGSQNVYVDFWLHRVERLAAQPCVVQGTNCTSVPLEFRMYFLSFWIHSILVGYVTTLEHKYVVAAGTEGRHDRKRFGVKGSTRFWCLVKEDGLTLGRYKCALMGLPRQRKCGQTNLKEVLLSFNTSASFLFTAYLSL